jgi:hypothetical protein
MRPIDILANILNVLCELEEDIQELNKFVESFGIGEFCSMLIEIICNT